MFIIKFKLIPPKIKNPGTRYHKNTFLFIFLKMKNIKKYNIKKITENKLKIIERSAKPKIYLYTVTWKKNTEKRNRKIKT